MPGVLAPQLYGDRLGQLAGGIFLDCCERRIAAEAEDFLPNQQAPFTERDQKLAGINYATDRLDIFDKEPAGEHGELWEDLSGIVREQVERVVETRPHALMTAGSPKPPALKQIQPTAKPGPNLRQRFGAYPG